MEFATVAWTPYQIGQIKDKFIRVVGAPNDTPYRDSGCGSGLGVGSKGFGDSKKIQDAMTVQARLSPASSEN